MRRPVDILCAGEFLIELITAEFASTPDEATLFRRVPGGSAAQLAAHMARLGHVVLPVAAVGNDDLGTVLKNFLARLGMETTYITQVEEPTTLMLVTRSSTITNTQAYRGADALLALRQFPYSRFEDIAIFHTTCFALSRLPAQRVLLEAAETARRARCELSLDVNYTEKIWPDRVEAQRIVAEYCRQNALVKISDADWEQLYEGPPTSPEAVLDHFLKMGAAEVCYTLGPNGCWVSDGQERCFLGARPLEIKDPTGAGDAFWAGYLAARFDGRSLEERTLSGRRLAELKLAGPLPEGLDRQSLYIE
jgi:fructokinase